MHIYFINNFIMCANQYKLYILLNIKYFRFQAERVSYRFYNYASFLSIIKHGWYSVA